jgi:hypothetical protein
VPGWALAAAAGAIAMYLLPYLVLGPDVHVPIHDNLDGVVARTRMLADSGLLFARGDTIVPAMMGGLPRAAFGSELNVLVWMFHLFGAFPAYVLNQALMRAVAFAGMLLLLRRHVVPGGPWPVAVGVALTFALLPFWPMGGLNVAGQPLALHAFLNVRAGTARRSDWAVILLLPLYASLVFAFAFFLAVMGLLWLRDAVVQRRANRPFLLAIVLMALVFSGVEYRLVWGLVDPAFVSHRTEFAKSTTPLGPALRLALQNFLQGQYHAHSLHGTFILPAAVAALLLGLSRRRTDRLLLSLVGLSAAISLFYGLWTWDGLDFLRRDVALLRMVNVTRFHFLHPMLWALIFALSLATIARLGRTGMAVAGLLLVAQIGLAVTHHPEWVGRRAGSPTWRAFFATDLFERLAGAIGRDRSEYRVVSLGLYPSVALYNGFRTLDGYHPSYPLAYKRAFRGIIAPELAKNPRLRAYFDGWGSRCYLMAGELGKRFDYDRRTRKSVNRLALDTRRLKAMGGDYVLSAVEIENAAAIGLRPLGVFADPRAAWRVRVYRVAP